MDPRDLETTASDLRDRAREADTEGRTMIDRGNELITEGNRLVDEGNRAIDLSSTLGRQADEAENGARSIQDAQDRAASAMSDARSDLNLRV